MNVQLVSLDVWLTKLNQGFFIQLHPFSSCAFERTKSQIERI